MSSANSISSASRTGSKHGRGDLADIPEKKKDELFRKKVSIGAREALGSPEVSDDEEWDGEATADSQTASALRDISREIANNKSRNKVTARGGTAPEMARVKSDKSATRVRYGRWASVTDGGGDSTGTDAYSRRRTGEDMRRRTKDPYDGEDSYDLQSFCRI